MVDAGYDRTNMKRAYLGDSYDAVKRLWQQVFAGWAPLYANRQFIPDDIQSEFTCLTGVPMLCGDTSGPYSVLNDPDTGIRLPDEDNQSESRKHITLATICGQLRREAARAIVTFDQSDYRHSKLKLDEQRRVKMRYITASGLFAFYYVSHAPFLFAFPSADMRHELRQRLLSFGVPDTRLETHE
jgi:hypothetical protein